MIQLQQLLATAIVALHMASLAASRSQKQIDESWPVAVKLPNNKIVYLPARSLRQQIPPDSNEPSAAGQSVSTQNVRGKTNSTFGNEPVKSISTKETSFWNPAGAIFKIAQEFSKFNENNETKPASVEQPGDQTLERQTSQVETFPSFLMNLLNDSLTGNYTKGDQKTVWNSAKGDNSSIIDNTKDEFRAGDSASLKQVPRTNGPVRFTMPVIREYSLYRDEAPYVSNDYNPINGDDHYRSGDFNAVGSSARSMAKDYNSLSGGEHSVSDSYNSIRDTYYVPEGYTSISGSGPSVPEDYNSISGAVIPVSQDYNSPSNGVRSAPEDYNFINGGTCSVLEDHNTVSDRAPSAPEDYSSTSGVAPAVSQQYNSPSNGERSVPEGYNFISGRARSVTQDYNTVSDRAPYAPEDYNSIDGETPAVSKAYSSLGGKAAEYPSSLAALPSPSSSSSDFVSTEPCKNEEYFQMKELSNNPQLTVEEYQYDDAEPYGTSPILSKGQNKNYQLNLANYQDPQNVEVFNNMLPTRFEGLNLQSSTGIKPKADSLQRAAYHYPNQKYWGFSDETEDWNPPNSQNVRNFNSSPRDETGETEANYEKEATGDHDNSLDSPRYDLDMLKKEQDGESYGKNFDKRAMSVLSELKLKNFQENMESLKDFLDFESMGHEEAIPTKKNSNMFSGLMGNQQLQIQQSPSSANCAQVSDAGSSPLMNDSKTLAFTKPVQSQPMTLPSPPQPVYSPGKPKHCCPMCEHGCCCSMKNALCNRPFSPVAYQPNMMMTPLPVATNGLLIGRQQCIGPMSSCTMGPCHMPHTCCCGQPTTICLPFITGSREPPCSSLQPLSFHGPSFSCLTCCK